MVAKVAILLAGYNGERFIREQLFSLLSQKVIILDIYIRVDGPSDRFRKCVEDFQNLINNVYYIKGDLDSSPSSNFYKLISSVNSVDYDYFAFCDQDDVWMDNKISSAISHLTASSAQGYSSGYTAFYSNGRRKYCSLGQMVKNDFYFQAGGPGCTYVLTSLGMELIQRSLQQNKYLLNVSAHDWLIYFILRINGYAWTFDPASHIYYRQHSNNVAGLNYGFLAKFNRLKLLFKGWYFEDLVLLLRYAKENDMISVFINPLTLRRTKLYSIIIWLYYWFYIVPKIGCQKFSTR